MHGHSNIILTFPQQMYSTCSAINIHPTQSISLTADKPPLYVNTLTNANQKSDPPSAKSTCKHLWYWHRATDCMQSVSCKALRHRQCSLKNRRRCNIPSDRTIQLISLKIFTLHVTQTNIAGVFLSLPRAF